MSEGSGKVPASFQDIPPSILESRLEKGVLKSYSASLKYSVKRPSRVPLHCLGQQLDRKLILVQDLVQSLENALRVGILRAGGNLVHGLANQV